MDFSTDWLTYLLLPSDKLNSRMARDRDLISSLINVASSRDEPFCQLQELQCLNHGATFVPFWSLILSSQPRKVTIFGRHIMAWVQDIKIAEVLLILCLAYYVTKWVQHCLNWGAMAFTYRGMRCTFHEYILRIFRNCWMDCKDTFHAVVCLYCCVTDRNIAEYKAYWLLGVPIINPWGVRFMSTFSVFSVMAGWIAKMLFMLFFVYIVVQRTEHSWVRSALAYGCSDD